MGARRRRATRAPSSSNMRACFPTSSISTARSSSPPGTPRSAICNCARCPPTRPKYLALSAASAPTSPIKQIFESVRDETALTRERKAPAPANGAAEEAKADVVTAASEHLGYVSRKALDLAMKSQRKAGDPPPEVPGASIEANFKPIQMLVDGEAGSRPIDALLANLNELYRQLTLAATNPTQAKQALDQVQVQVASLR